jgi:protein-disulfide isomerase
MPSSLNKKNPFSFVFLLIFFIAVIIGGLYLLNKMTVDKKSENYTPLTYEFDLENQPFYGDPNAPNIIVKLTDFKCPACKMWEENVFPRLKEDVLDTGKARLYVINFPLDMHGADAVFAAATGEAIFNQNPDAFWDYYELIYENQGNQSEQWATKDFLFPLIEKHLPSIDIKKLEKDIESDEIKKALQKDLTLTKEANASGTPTLFVNDTRVEEWVDGRAEITPFDYDQIITMMGEN